MSTRSAIIEKTANGYRGIYCHFDGYVTGVGKTLHEHYRDPDKIRRLIDLGDIASLGERVEPEGEHSYDRREEGTTVAYCRDRGEPMDKPAAGATAEAVAKDIGHNGYVYVWEDGRWTVNGEPLEEKLAAVRRNGPDGDL